MVQERHPAKVTLSRFTGRVLQLFISVCEVFLSERLLLHDDLCFHGDLLCPADAYSALLNGR